MTDRDKLIAAMDLQQINWHISFADQVDLQQLARGDCSMESLRRRMADRLMMPIRAALASGMVAITKDAPQTQ
jgi:hypothetical protein